MKSTISIIALLCGALTVTPIYTATIANKGDDAVFCRPNTVREFKDLDPHWTDISEAPFPVVTIHKDCSITIDRKKLRKQFDRMGIFYLLGDGIPIAELGTVWSVTQRFLQETPDVKTFFASTTTPDGHKSFLDEENFPSLNDHHLKKFSVSTALNAPPVVYPNKEMEQVWQACVVAFRPVELAILNLLADMYQISDTKYPTARTGVSSHKRDGLYFLAYPDTKGQYLRVRAHKDVTWCTIIFQAPAINGFNALEVKINDKWHPVPCIRNALVIFCGKPFEAVTGCKPLMHRVRHPGDNMRGEGAREIIKRGVHL